MKHSNKFFSLMMLAVLSLALVFTSCEDDEPTKKVSKAGASLDTLNQLITESNGLLDGASEGLEVDQYEFGAITSFTDILDKSKKVAENLDSDAAVVGLASDELKTALELFKTKKATIIATPWVQQTVGNRMVITDSKNGTDRGALGLIDNGKDFTIEFRMKFISLKNLGFANTLLSAAKQFGSDDKEVIDNGFHIRVYADGKLQLTVGEQDEPWFNSAITTDSIKEGEWYHFAYAHSGSDQIMYLNQVEVLRATQNYTSVTNVTTVNGIALGSAFDWPDRVSNVLYEDIKVWSKAVEPQNLNNKEIKKTGDGLEAWFPLNFDQGSTFTDVSGSYQLELTSFVKWAPGGDVTKIEVDYSELNTSIAAAETFIGTLTEGTAVGDFGVGTGAFLTTKINAAKAVVNSGTQNDAVNATSSLDAAVKSLKENKITEVGDANGLTLDLSNSESKGFQIFKTDGSSDLIPDGSYTIEVEVFVKDEDHPNAADENIVSLIFGNGSIQFRFVTEKASDNLGAVEFWASTGGWQEVRSEPGKMEFGKWVSLAATYDESNKISKVYLGGTEIASDTLGGNYEASWDHFWLGNAFGDPFRLNGSARDLRVWSNLRNVADLNKDILGTESGLEMYFPLDKKNAPSFADETGKFFGSRVGVEFNEN